MGGDSLDSRCVLLGTKTEAGIRMWVGPGRKTRWYQGKKRSPSKSATGTRSMKTFKARQVVSTKAARNRAKKRARVVKAYVDSQTQPVRIRVASPEELKELTSKHAVPQR